MQSLNKILVCLDPEREQQPALQKAIYLAKAYQATVELFLVVYNRGLVSNLFFNNEQLEAAKQGYINSQKRWVGTFVSEVAQAGVSCSSDIVWHKPLYEAIIKKAKASECDLIIKSTHPHPTINKVFFTPNDWQLLKSSPIPLILAKQVTAVDYQRVLCAIDPSQAHDKPETLNEKIVSSGVQLSEKINAQCNVTHCYDPIGYQLWSDIGLGMGVGLGPTDFTMGEENYEAYISQLKKTQEERFTKVISHFEFEPERLHLVEGYPETELPDLVKRLDIDLLVLGTTYHSGLVGSTAEKILDQVSCDVLSVQIDKDK